MNSVQNIIWPPAYRLIRHRRAKSVKLRASEVHGLEITIPNRFSLKHLPSILEEHRDWITKQLSKIEPLTLPNILNLQALHQVWHVEYIDDERPMKLKYSVSQQLIQVIGNITDQTLCQKKLLLWIKKIASHFLLERITYISQQIGLPFLALSIRQQKTLWGSCTVDKKISLNMKLIFLPLELVDYIIIHELCHTMHLNHSERYWKLVARFDPIWKKHRAMLRKADQFIPALLI